MSFRDQKFHRVDQSMMYSVNNTAKSNHDFNNLKIPETMKKPEKPEERAKPNVGFDFKTAFNQANLLSEQAAQIGNAHKTNNILADLLGSKDQGNIFSALNLTFESGPNSSNASRNFNS